MERNKMNICILGGGTAGFMTAATLVKLFPKYKIKLIESPKEKTVGVGESTILGFKAWLNLLEIKDEDFMRECNAIYKLSIKFTDFYKKGQSFHYPFGELKQPIDDWWLCKIANPKLPNETYASYNYEAMTQIEQKLMHYHLNFKNESAYHFDAKLFADWLKNKFCIPKGLEYIQEHIEDIQQDEDGIKSLNGKHEADLYIDCTGFKSILLGKTLGEPFESYEDLLPNNSAWATRIEYKDKKKELVPYTNCTAYNNGWIWNIPLWNRIGTGYVYSDKFIDDEMAYNEFRNYLGGDELEFNKIKFTPGIHRRLFVKNVCAIGLSAGFIEPLESNGLYTVHQFLINLVRNMQRDKISQWDKDNFTFGCKKIFKTFSDFVALHYALSHRTDTEYWKSNFNKTWDERLYTLEPSLIFSLVNHAFLRDENFSHDTSGGAHCIAAGMDWKPNDINMIKLQHNVTEKDILIQMNQKLEEIKKRKERWIEECKEEGVSFLDFHKHNVYY
jgi:flavin-dependent dehydrogenase